MMIFRGPDIEDVRDMLRAAELDASDLERDDLAHFFGARQAHSLVGVIGLELFTSCALLRSLAVVPTARNSGTGKTLVNELESHARNLGVKRLYLLTDTAEHYFSRLGYRAVPREAAPDDIRGTAQFSALCPDSATLMVKPLDSVGSS